MANQQVYDPRHPVMYAPNLRPTDLPIVDQPELHKRGSNKQDVHSFTENSSKATGGVKSPTHHTDISEGNLSFNIQFIVAISVRKETLSIHSSKNQKESTRLMSRK